MPEIAVYDVMVFVQWAALPPASDRQHATVKALGSGAIRLAMSKPLLDEIRDVLFRPELRKQLPSLTPVHAGEIVNKVIDYSQVFESVPNIFTWPQHPDDDHLFNLAIIAKAKYVVTWESRILELPRSATPAAESLRALAPQLSIVTPADLAGILKASSAKSDIAR